MREVLQEHMMKHFGMEGWDPILRLAEIAENSTTPIDLKIASLKAIAPYVAPQLKAVDLKVSGEVGVRHQLISKLAQALDNASLEDALKEVRGEVLDHKPQQEHEHKEEMLDHSTTMMPLIEDDESDPDDPGLPEDDSDK